MGWVKGWAAINALWLIPVVFTAWLAARENRSAPFWGMTAFFSGWFGFIALVLTRASLGRGRPIEPVGVEPPDLRDPHTRLATSVQTTADGPTERSLILWIVGLAVVSAIVFGSASLGARQAAQLDIDALGMATATDNAVRMVTGLERRHDDMTLGTFVRERIRTMCGDEAADEAMFSAFISKQSGSDVFWAVYVTLPEIEPTASCDELAISQFNQLGVAGIDSRNATIVPIFAQGQPAERGELFNPTLLEEFEAGKAA